MRKMTNIEKKTQKKNFSNNKKVKKPVLKNADEKFDFEKKRSRNETKEPYKNSELKEVKESRKNFKEKSSNFENNKHPKKRRFNEGLDGKRNNLKVSENFIEKSNKGNARNIERKSRIKSSDKNHKSFNKKGREETRLNKFISNSGICSRREADVLISSGVVKVNGEIITIMGFQVKPGDKVTVDGREIKSEKKVYILLNKPKDTITTTDDPSGRKTVMDIVGNACKERVYPVGRLDRNTTGLLLLTNDGEMAKRLMHPSHRIIKVYEATLNKNITIADMKNISNGVELDGDFIPIDGIALADPDKKNIVGLEIHSGKYHIVKRIFEKFGYEVVKLDRTMYGPLTKKNLPRGTWRLLTDSEISILHRL